MLDPVLNSPVKASGITAPSFISMSQAHKPQPKITPNYLVQSASAPLTSCTKQCSTLYKPEQSTEESTTERIANVLRPPSSTPPVQVITPAVTATIMPTTHTQPNTQPPPFPSVSSLLLFPPKKHVAPYRSKRSTGIQLYSKAAIQTPQLSVPSRSHYQPPLLTSDTNSS